MYSYEIEQFINSKTGILRSVDYLQVLHTSPQIRNVEYNSQDDTFRIYTDDQYNFNFKVIP